VTDFSRTESPAMSEDLRPDRANRIADAVENIERNVDRLRDFLTLAHD